MKNQKLLTAVIILLVLNICATCFIGFSACRPAEQAEESETSAQFVMYVGTNDKDTYAQIIPTEEAKEIIDRICFKYLGGYTIQDAVGSWVDETGTATHENTIVCYFDGTDEETVHRIADEIILELNQNTVLIETTSVRMEYYGGAE